MVSRIHGLEKSLAEVTNERQASRLAVCESPRSDGGGPGQTPVTPACSVYGDDRPREDVLVQKGSSTQYFSEIIFSRVLGQENDIDSVLTPPPTESSYPILSPFNALGILSGPSFAQRPCDFHPNRLVAAKLWNKYIENVEDCPSLKLLHIPTDEVKVYTTIEAPSKAPFESLALCFAIYFVTTISLQDEEVQTLFGQTRNSILLGFKAGLEQALAHGDFLDRPTISGLQAMAIYLSALRVHNRGKGIWILNGLVIRIAESLGLHRDGERLGLSPFECEIRRRLWWHLLSRDGRASEDYGLENTNGLILTSAVQLPLNVDDCDLYPGMKVIPAARLGWTSMTFSLINIDLIKFMQALGAFAASSSSSASPPADDSVRARRFEETRSSIEGRLANCNPVIPRQRMTMFCARFLLRKFEFIQRQQWRLLHRTSSREDFTTEETLIEALEILEPRLVVEDEMFQQFIWVRRAFPQYHVTLYILWHLCIKPAGPNVGRAWAAIDTCFGQEEADEATVGFGSKFAVLAALKAKASVVRERLRKENQVEGMKGGGQVQQMDSQGANMDVFGGVAAGECFDFDIGSDEWPNWDVLAQGFYNNDQEFPSVLW
ncbi:hypothetical protein MMC25_006112 [Agyrium rufum]|nr:hypothetical protein [Agyrium rufum]